MQHRIPHILYIALACASLLTPLILASACQPAEKSGQSQRNGFATTDASELFFKNVRSPFYDYEEVAEGKLRVFRLKKRTEEAEYPLVNLALVWNWLHDEAYLLLEPNAVAWPNDSLVVQWQNPNTQQIGHYVYVQGNKANQTLFAGKVYNSIKEGHILSLPQAGNAPLFSQSREKEAFRISVYDYYRLTEKL